MEYVRLVQNDNFKVDNVISHFLRRLQTLECHVTWLMRTTMSLMEEKYQSSGQPQRYSNFHVMINWTHFESLNSYCYQSDKEYKTKQKNH